MEEYKAIIEAFKKTADTLEVVMSKVIIINPKFVNVKDTEENTYFVSENIVRSNASDIADFDYTTEREALALFILSICIQFFKQSMLLP